MKRRSSLAAALLATACLAAPVSRCLAQIQALPGLSQDGITVFGTGELSARPNQVEVDFTVMGKAELTGDAIVKFRDAKKRAIEAIEKLKLPNCTIEELALTITAGNTAADQQQRMMNGQAPAAGKTQIDVSSVLRVRLKNVRDIQPEELIKTVGKLIDTAQDSGVSIGPSAAELMRNMRFGMGYTPTATPVRFIVADLTKLREKAYEQAVADARARATRLAKLNHLKLGNAASVQEVQVAGDQTASAPGNVVNSYIYINQPNSTPPASADDDDEPKIASNSLSGMPIQVKLLVRFAISGVDPATAQQ